MGKKAVFCRFSGCNLWSGREKDREKSICSFCDTDFVGTDGQNGAKYNSAKILAQKIDEIWSNNCKDKMVVFTGGEPLLQLNDELIEEVHKRNFKIAIETKFDIEIKLTGINHVFDCIVHVLKHVRVHLELQSCSYNVT